MKIIPYAFVFCGGEPTPGPTPTWGHRSGAPERTKAMPVRRVRAPLAWGVARPSRPHPNLSPEPDRFALAEGRASPPGSPPADRGSGAPPSASQVWLSRLEGSTVATGAVLPTARPPPRTRSRPPRPPSCSPSSFLGAPPRPSSVGPLPPPFPSFALPRLSSSSDSPPRPASPSHRSSPPPRPGPRLGPFPSSPPLSGDAGGDGGGDGPAQEEDGQPTGPRKGDGDEEPRQGWAGEGLRARDRRSWLILRGTRRAPGGGGTRAPRSYLEKVRFLVM